MTRNICKNLSTRRKRQVTPITKESLKKQQPRIYSVYLIKAFVVRCREPGFVSALEGHLFRNSVGFGAKTVWIRSNLASFLEFQNFNLICCKLEILTSQDNYEHLWKEKCIYIYAYMIVCVRENKSENCVCVCIYVSLYIYSVYIYMQMCLCDYSYVYAHLHHVYMCIHASSAVCVYIHMQRCDS